jgi:hypothetical protein
VRVSSCDDAIFTVVNQPDSGAIFIFIAAAAPDKSSVGATNGLCQVRFMFISLILRLKALIFHDLLQVVVSITRGVGPAVATSLFSLSMAHNWFGGYLVYYLLVLVAGMAFFVSSKLPSSL